MMSWKGVDVLAKRSCIVTVALVASVAASMSLTGCSDNSQCVDASGRPLPSGACRGTSGGHYYSGAHWVSHGGGWGGGTMRGGFGGHGFGGG